MRSKNHKKLNNRVISCLLSALLVLTTIYNIPIKNGVQAGYINGTVPNISLVPFNQSSQTFTIVPYDNGDSGIGISYINDSAYTVIDPIPMGCNITIQDYAGLKVSTDAELGNIILQHFAEMSSSSLSIDSGVELSVSGLTANDRGSVFNSGPFIIDEYNSDTLSNDGVIFYNNGTIKASTVKLYNSSYDNSSTGIINATTSFYKDNFDLNATVVADENTTITSTGGTFVLTVAGSTRTISDPVDGENAGDLLKVEIDFDPSPIQEGDEVYAGNDYDKLIVPTFSEGYDGNWRIQYYSDDEGKTPISKEDITTSGDYYFSIIADATSSFLGNSTSIENFNTVLIPSDEVSVTLSGLKNGIYAQDTVTVVPSSGYKITKYADYNALADTLELTKNDLYPEGNGGNFYEGLYFNLRRTSDGAYTQDVWWNNVTPNMQTIIFDEADPALSGSILADGEAVEVTSGEEIVADKVTFTIVDENLDSVKVNGTANTIDETDDGYKSDVSIDVPEGAAKQYTIVSEDKSGRSYTLSMKLKHTRKTATAEVSVPNTTEGEDYEPTVTTDSDGKDEATFLYKARAVTDDSAFSSTKPTVPGTYVVRATIPQTDYYEEIVCENTFTISEKEEEPDTEEPTTEEPDPEEPNTENPPENLPKKDATITVKTHDQFYGVVYDYPSVETNSDGAITFMYKAKGAADSTLSLEKPTAIGTYVVRAYVAESDNYNANRADAEFTISYLDAPTDAYSLQGDKGNNDYYITDVRIVAPTGYEISSSLDGLFTGSISYSDTLKSVYLRRKADGAKTSSISFDEKLKIDTVYPSVGYSVKDQDNNSVNLSGSYYADQVTFTISDDHLQTVLVNNEKVQISDNKATITIDSANGIKSFSISAEDEAGNVFEAEVTIEATWRIKMVLPSGEVVPLVPGEEYKLGKGTWTTDKDPYTVYSGEQTVFVSGEGGNFQFDPQ